MIKYTNDKLMRLCLRGVAAALIVTSSTAIAQDVQVRSEAVVGGSDAVVIPDLYDDYPGVAYDFWVPPADGRDFKTIGFRPTGGLIVLDGTIFREFRADGSERYSSAFPVDCTKLNFQSPKGQGSQDTSLNDCDASVILLDNTMRIYGNVKGQGLKGIAYDLENPNGENSEDNCSVTFSSPPTAAEMSAAESRVCGAYRVTKEPPPQITDAIADESENAIAFRDGPRILVAGDRKSVFAIAMTTDITVLDSEDAVVPVATFNGSKIDSIAVAGQYLVIAFDDGVIRRFDTGTGTDDWLFAHTLCEDPALGRKTPQRFGVRQDPDETVVFALNRACGNLVVLDPYAPSPDPVTNPNLAVIDTDGDGEGYFALSDTDGTIYPEAVDARPGESGTFADCEEGETCQLGQIADQLTQSNSTLVEIETYDPSYRMFQSYLTDCRSAQTSPCPIMNPGETDPRKQILNLTELFILSDSTGELERLVPNRDDPATISGDFRGERYFPRVPGTDCKYAHEDDPHFVAQDLIDYPPAEFCFNNYEFYSFFAVSDVVFDGPFELTFEVDQFRLNDGVVISYDPCPVPPGLVDSEREAVVNDRANVGVYNRDTYDTIDGTKSEMLTNYACGSGKMLGGDWSWHTVGLEPADFTARDFLDLAERQLADLFKAKEQLLCSPFTDPDTGESVQILGTSDCALLQTELEQVEEKATVCFAALHDPQQGASRENCGALFAHIANLQNSVQTQITRPDPTNPADIPKLKPAYLSEFEIRVEAFRFSTDEWLLNVTPEDGIPLP